ncbi:hypothetical protein V7S43_010141 [Phytophthora oleae]|uniref:Crinkler effector protein N-terminal domain-containing protein n=1 Tax=Phytophthora oleae TaxID=2107226 RepID=A0ABD3FFB3_9STRA
MTISSFKVNIDEDDDVSALQKAIVEMRPNDLKNVDAGMLQLFLANTKAKNPGEENREERKDEDKEEADTEKGVWLSDTSDAALALLEGTVHQVIQSYISGEQIRPAQTIQDVLEHSQMPEPQPGQIHELVVRPDIPTAQILPSPERRIWISSNIVMK